MRDAPRADACAADSRTKAAAASPRAKPLRSAEKGRHDAATDADDEADAETGASTRIACQLASTPGVSIDSLPPAMATSIQPARMARIASPIATADEAHAQAYDSAAPRAPNSSAISARGAFGIVVTT